MRRTKIADYELRKPRSDQNLQVDDLLVWNWLKWNVDRPNEEINANRV